MKHVIRLSICLILVVCCFGESLIAQTEGTVKGYVRDASNGETLIGATILIAGQGTGTTTNEYGFYSLTIPSGKYTLVVNYLGYAEVRKEVDLTLSATLDFELAEEGTLLEEVVVTAEEEDANVSNLEMSVEQLDVKTLQKIPALLGEVDVLRGIQLLPGVTSVGEGAAGFNVRGGSIDQNLVILDEAPVFNSSHLFGFFSVFNPDAVKGVKLYKGGIPARYGGRLSSILDVRMREGNNKALQVDGGIGTIFSRLSVEAPIVKDKSSFLLAGRRSYIDVLAAPFLTGDLQDTELYFYDLTLKTNYKFSDKDQLFLSGYLGRDVFAAGGNASFNWGNKTTTLRWNHLFSDKLFSNLTGYFSDYDYAIIFGADNPTDGFDWNARIVNLSLKPEFTLFVKPNNVIRFGGQGIHYRFEPANAVAVSDGETLDISLANQRALEAAVFIEQELTLGETGRIKLNYGLRGSYFAYLGGGDVYTYDQNTPAGRRKPLIGITSSERGEIVESYANLEPRASLQYSLNTYSSLKASYQRTAQYIHLLSNTVASIPLDLWTPSTNNIVPQLADQLALGYFRNSTDNIWEFSIEGYYKKFYDLVEYIDEANLQLNQLVEGDVVTGNGRAYGAEFDIKRTEGKFSGWLAYTLARTERQVEGVNDGEWYPTRFDQTHNLSLTGFYDLNQRLSFSANFVYNTGTPFTPPAGGYYNLGYYIPQVNGRNTGRLPDYHRLDLSATLEGKTKKKNGTPKRLVGEWVFSAYNVYGRRNAFNIYGGELDARVPQGQPVQVQAQRLSVVGSIIPAVSYNFSFK